MPAIPGFIVPFTDWEWNRAKFLFRSTSVSEIRECLSLLSMWRSRMGDKTPVAISCSDLLLRVAMDELLTKDKSDWIRMEAIKMSYCIAIIRFINYANEIGQKENRLLNMFEAVGQLGFPRWVVEIRHLAAHSHVPPIETLRSATKICVEWLWNNFWARKTAREAIRASMTGDSLIENPFIAKRENKYRKVIVAYANWRYRNPTVPADYRTSSKEVLEFERLLMNETHEFSRCLIDDGMMIMTKQQYDNEYAPYVTNETSVPTRLQNFWEPIITILYERKIAAELLVLLLARLSDPSISSFTSIQIAAWTRMMIVPCAETAMEFYSELDWSRILTKIIYLPNFFGAEVIEKVMNKVPNLNPQKRKKLRKLREISKFSEPSEVVSSSLPKTVEDLQRLLAFEEMKRKSLQPTALFELCDADEWSTLPIGLPPRANVKTFTLTMDDEFLGRLRAQEREQRDFSEPPVSRKRKAD